MKFVFLLFTSVLLSFTICKGQQKQESTETDCLSQQNKRKIYAALKELILKNVSAEIQGVGYTYLQYDDLTLTHWFVPSGMEIIEVVDEKLYYQLVYGRHFGDKDVTTEIRDLSEGKGKIERKKVEQHFCEVLSKMKFNIRLSAKEAVAIAKKDAGGFLGTWTQTSLKNGNWHINSFSRGLKSPNYYVVDAETGKILLKLDNADDPDQKKKLEEFIRNVKKG